MGGHSWVMDKPKDLIDRYRNWAMTIRDLYRSLSAEEDYRYMFDPYWVRVEPYRAAIPSGGSAEATAHVRNFLNRPQTYRLALHCPEGIVAEPAVLEGIAPPTTTVQVPLRLKATSRAKQGVQLIALDATLDGRRYGEWFDFTANVANVASEGWQGLSDDLSAVSEANGPVVRRRQRQYGRQKRPSLDRNSGLVARLSGLQLGWRDALSQCLAFGFCHLQSGADARRSRGALCHRHSTGLAAACRLDSRHLHDKSAGLRQSESLLF